MFGGLCPGTTLLKAGNTQQLAILNYPEKQEFDFIDHGYHELASHNHIEANITNTQNTDTSNARAGTEHCSADTIEHDVCNRDNNALADTAAVRL